MLSRILTGLLWISIFVLSFTLIGCGQKKVNAVVDTLYIDDQVKYEKDKEHCQQVALTYDLSDEKVQNALLYGAVGGGATTGAALALGAGFIHPIAIPVIAGASILGVAAGAMSTNERQARENIMYQCLAKHGYTAYNPNSNSLVK